jgi:hypothetical protein
MLSRLLTVPLASAVLGWLGVLPVVVLLLLLLVERGAGMMRRVYRS